MAGLFARMTDEVLTSDFGEETVLRAHRYATDGSVQRVQVVDHTDRTARALATVAGSGRRSYSVLLSVTADEDEPDGWWGVDVWSRCSCAMAAQCKHGAALAMVLAGGVRGPGSDRAWQRSLDAVLEDLEAPTRIATPKALAIRLEMGSRPVPRWGRPEGGVRLRLVTMGARGQWIKTGISWSTVATATASGSHDPAQLAALRQLHAGLTSSVSYYNAADEPPLASFGALLWPGLAEAVAGGVALVPGSGVRSVALSATPVEVTADVLGVEDGARLVVGVQQGDRLWAGDAVRVVGRPVHGVVLVDAADPDPDVLLAPLARPAPASLGELVTATEPVRLPERDRPHWQQVTLPRLARSVRLGSSDGSVDLQPLPPPRLRLTLRWDSGVTALLEWEWVYGDGPAARRCTVDSDVPLDGLRDRAAEAATLLRLVGEGAWPWRPVGTERVTGPVALRLALDLVPTLAGSELVETGLVEVVEHGRPDFRSADDAVEVSFRTQAEPGPPTGRTTGPPTGRSTGSTCGSSCTSVASRCPCPTSWPP